MYKLSSDFYLSKDICQKLPTDDEKREWLVACLVLVPLEIYRVTFCMVKYLPEASKFHFSQLILLIPVELIYTRMYYTLL